MRKVLLATFGLIFAVGCTLPQRYTIDVDKIEGCEDFDWNGRVIVTKTYKGIFTGYTVDLIKIESRDGRAMLLDARRKKVETYVKAKVDSSGQQAHDPAIVRQKQSPPDQ